LEGTSEVAKASREAEALRPLLSDAEAVLDSKRGVAAAKRDALAAAEAAAARCTAELAAAQAAATLLRSNTTNLQKSCVPSLAAAEAAMRKMTRADVADLRGAKNPSQTVVGIVEAICVIYLAATAEPGGAGAGNFVPGWPSTHPGCTAGSVLFIGMCCCLPSTVCPQLFALN
jgi:hypothetical protein